ncbi:hypothetical protein HDU76_012570 [Blyttiomyces sp. JEL0837]|nr:hypothetical protein HDU76_012570 [Blyttiomyces sp. JEL0837]
MSSDSTLFPEALMGGAQLHDSIFSNVMTDHNFLFSAEHSNSNLEGSISNPNFNHHLQASSSNGVRKSQSAQDVSPNKLDDAGVEASTTSSKSTTKPSSAKLPSSRRKIPSQKRSHKRRPTSTSEDVKVSSPTLPSTAHDQFHISGGANTSSGSMPTLTGTTMLYDMDTLPTMSSEVSLSDHLNSMIPLDPFAGVLHSSDYHMNTTQPFTDMRTADEVARDMRDIFELGANVPEPSVGELMGDTHQLMHHDHDLRRVNNIFLQHLPPSQHDFCPIISDHYSTELPQPTAMIQEYHHIPSHAANNHAFLGDLISPQSFLDSAEAELIRHRARGNFGRDEDADFDSIKHLLRWDSDVDVLGNTLPSPPTTTCSPDAPIPPGMMPRYPRMAPAYPPLSQYSPEEAHALQFRPHRHHHDQFTPRNGMASIMMMEGESTSNLDGMNMDINMMMSGPSSSTSSHFPFHPPPSTSTPTHHHPFMAPMIAPPPLQPPATLSNGQNSQQDLLRPQSKEHTRARSSPPVSFGVMNQPPAQSTTLPQAHNSSGSLPLMTPSSPSKSPKKPSSSSSSSSRNRSSTNPNSSSSSRSRRTTSTKKDPQPPTTQDPSTSPKFQTQENTTNNNNNLSPQSRKVIDMADLIRQNDTLRAQVAEAQAAREREAAESGMMLETLNRLMGIGGAGGGGLNEGSAGANASAGAGVGLGLGLDRSFVMGTGVGLQGNNGMGSGRPPMFGAHPGAVHH